MNGLIRPMATRDAQADEPVHLFLCIKLDTLFGAAGQIDHSLFRCGNSPCVTSSSILKPLAGKAFVAPRRWRSSKLEPSIWQAAAAPPMTSSPVSYAQ